jgi:hypothetical protein
MPWLVARSGFRQWLCAPAVDSCQPATPETFTRLC